jgi:hypothetical protein
MVRTTRHALGRWRGLRGRLGLLRHHQLAQLGIRGQHTMDVTPGPRRRDSEAREAAHRSTLGSRRSPHGGELGNEHDQQQHNPVRKCSEAEGYDLERD